VEFAGHYYATVTAVLQDSHWPSGSAFQLRDEGCGRTEPYLIWYTRRLRFALPYLFQEELTPSDLPPDIPTRFHTLLTCGLPPSQWLPEQPEHTVDKDFDTDVLQAWCDCLTDLFGPSTSDMWDRWKTTFDLDDWELKTIIYNLIHHPKYTRSIAADTCVARSTSTATWTLVGRLPQPSRKISSAF